MTDPVIADTAAAIALVRAEESRRPADERLFDDPYASLFAGGPALSAGNARLFEVPFFREQIRLRTRFIDDFLADGLARGMRQVVILGAGFDCRALRLPGLCDAAIVFEVDLSMQIERKRSILARAGVPVPSRLRSIACDFNEPGWESRLAGRLADAGFDGASAALFVLEGVISYLEKPGLEEAFHFMATAAGAGSAAVFNFNLARLDPAELGPLASRAGFARSQSSSVEALWRRYLPGEPPPGGAIFFVGEAFR